MEKKVHLVLRVLVFLICSSHFGGQTFDEPFPTAHPTEDITIPSSLPQTTGMRQSPVPETTSPVQSSAVLPAALANSTSNATSPQSPGRNDSLSSSNDTARTPTVSTSPPAHLNSTHTHTTSEVPTDSPESIDSSSPPNNTVPELTQSPGGNVQSTSTLAVSTHQPASSTPPAGAPQSTSRPPPESQSTSPTSPAITPPTRGKAHQDTPSQLNVGDDDAGLTPQSSGPSPNPLLAGLVSVFILAAAIVSLLLFLKFRQRNERPEFRRLQDLPMDDMMEDTPLSIYNY